MAPVRRRPVLLLLVSLLLVLVALAQAAATTTTTTPAHGGKGVDRACAAAFQGCLRCTKGANGVPTTCASCRANSAFDAVAGTCACNAPDYGTFSKELWDEYVKFYLCGNSSGGGSSNKKHHKGCRRPPYSTVAGKCVKCSTYGSAVAVDGACVFSNGVGGFRNTDLTIRNDFDDEDAAAWILRVNIGVCSSLDSCTNDNNYMTPKLIDRGESVWAGGYSYGSSIDIGAKVSFCGKGRECDKPPMAAYVWAGNPTLRLPFVYVEEAGNPNNYVNLPLSEGETAVVDLRNVARFTVTREADTDSSKQLVVKVSYVDY